MPVEGLEATLKAITLIEDFTAFDAQLPQPRYRALFEILKDALHDKLGFHAWITNIS